MRSAARRSARSTSNGSWPRRRTGDGRRHRRPRRLHRREVEKVARRRLLRHERERRRARQSLRRAHERTSELSRVVPLWRIGTTGTLDDRAQRTHRVGHREQRVDPRHQRRHRRVGRERHLARHRLDQHERERVHVGLAVDRLALRLLGRGVARGAEHDTRRLGPRRFGDRPRQARSRRCAAAPPRRTAGSRA